MNLVAFGLHPEICERLVKGGFAPMDLDTVSGAPPWLEEAFAQFGGGFRVRLVASHLDPLINHLVFGVRRSEELTELEAIAPSALMYRGVLPFQPPAEFPAVELSAQEDCDNDELVHKVTQVCARLPRVPWDTYFMRICRQVALRSDCLKRHVAAIIVKDKRIVSTGYNGTPRGVSNCSQGGCPRCATFGPSGSGLGDCLCSHGEENAITQAAYHGISVKGATLYTTTSPCLLCTKMIINSGISEVVFNSAYPLGEQPLALLRTAGVVTRQAEVQE